MLNEGAGERRCPYQARWTLLISAGFLDAAHDED